MRTVPLTVGNVALASVLVAIIAAGIWMWIDETHDFPLMMELSTPSGLLRVEVADRPHSRALGLSSRPEPREDGLLLQWEGVGRHPIWMVDMQFSLDLVWLDQRARVLAVMADVAPCARQPCPLYEPPMTQQSTAVLELRGGEAARRGITAGIRLSAPTPARHGSR